MNRRIFFLLLNFIFVAGLYAQRNPDWATPVDAKYAFNLYMVDSGIYRCAQPDKAAFAELKRLGIGEAVNLRYFNFDGKPASAASITVHHVKMLAGKGDWDKLVKTLQIIKNRQGSIVIHCKHGADRTGLVLALYRIVFQEWSREDAIDELKNGGYNFHAVYSNIPEFIGNVEIEALKKAVFQD